MTDKGDNVVPFPNRPNLDPVPSVDAVNRATASQTSRAERDAVVRARADDIRKTVASFSGRISHSHRLVLAGNLGRLLYGSESKRKHGDLSRILQAAGVAEEGDHTKRLPRYAIRPDRSPPSAKTLASRPKNYLLIAEAAANQFGIDRDKSVVLVFSGVQLGGEEPDYDLAEYFSLYRLLNAFLDGIIKTTKVDNYFKSLAKWRWISRTDEYQRAASVAPFSLDEDELDDYGALHPDAVGRWGADVNHFEADSKRVFTKIEYHSER